MNTIAADALDPCITRPSAAMVLPIHDNNILVLHEGRTTCAISVLKNNLKNANTLINKTHESADIVAVGSLNQVLTDTPAHSACFSRGQHVAAGCQQTNVALRRWLHSCSHKITKTFKFKVHNHLLSHNNWLLGSGRKGGLRLITWFCYHLIAKPGNKTGALPWPEPYIHTCI